MFWQDILQTSFERPSVQCWKRRNTGVLGLKFLDAIREGQFDAFQTIMNLCDNVQQPFFSGSDESITMEAPNGFGLAILESRQIGLQFTEFILRKTQCHPQTTVSWQAYYQDEDVFNKNETAMLAAISTAFQPIVELMIKSGADVNHPARDRIKRTPLQKAAETGDVAIVQLLLDHGADVNGQPALVGGGTALQLAAIQGHPDIVQLLLDNGAEINAPTSIRHGRTALEGAAEHGRIDMVILLLQRGAHRDSNQISRAITLAKENNHDTLAEMLEAEWVTGGSQQSDNGVIQSPSTVESQQRNIGIVPQMSPVDPQQVDNITSQASTWELPQHQGGFYGQDNGQEIDLQLDMFPDPWQGSYYGSPQQGPQGFIFPET